MIDPRKAFILLLGDDGALLLPPSVASNALSLYAHANDAAETKILRDEIESLPRAPIILLCDTQAQHLKHEDLPALSLWDRRKLARNRLQLAFASLAHKNCLVGKTSSLSVGLEASGTFQIWLRLLEGLKPERTIVPCSLPVESASLMVALAPEAKQGWAMMIGLHKTGGIRQIVTRDGRVLFTRLTPPITGSTSGGFVAASLALEIQATRDYLARFGLMAETPMHLIALVPPAIKEAVDATPLSVTSRTVLTAHEAAPLLRLRLTPVPGEDMVDILHALWLAQRPRITLPLTMEEAQARHNTQQVIKFGYAIALAVFLFALLRLFFSLAGPLSLIPETSRLKEETAKIEAAWQQERAANPAPSQPIADLRKAAERQRLFVPEQPVVVEILNAIAPDLAAVGTVTQLDWAQGTLTLSIKPAESDRVEDREADTLLLAALREKLPGAKIDLRALTETSGLELTIATEETRK